MAVRMMPVGTLFQRYARVVYDIAQSTGKQIRLETDGEETEIDKSMLELLGDPLTHLIRNAADHGIAEEADLSDDQIRMLIFAPGFSTREEVSDLSGRGVGMDVVRRNVQQLSG